MIQAALEKVKIVERNIYLNPGMKFGKEFKYLRQQCFKITYKNKNEQQKNAAARQRQNKKNVAKTYAVGELTQAADTSAGGASPVADAYDANLETKYMP
ncbi:hypothetical protein CYMTET_33101 [Cymbomonas tetramitiformis]|uniref:Uncharacterized protein n=1 Tax=Cymbomonas tetramitiformis TaxID=36881 RepID=A0AAE0KRJ9_9CHLO|nr:hypothetical protein CYMTET_33101 [Cymbomonas tetramitiformis]